MKVVALIQARMGSERLPGKVLKSLHGHTILDWVVSRVKQSQFVTDVIVATTTSSKDDEIVKACQELGVESFRGSELDVLERFYEAAKAYHADIVVRICSDCPLIDASIIDTMLEYFIEKNKVERLDYISNTIDRTFPRGLDAEIMSFSTLKRAYEEGKQPAEREHVTPYIYHNLDIFEVEQYSISNSHADCRWTLDTESDFAFLNELVGLCPNPDKLSITTAELLICLQNNPSLMDINAHIKQKELPNV